MPIPFLLLWFWFLINCGLSFSLYFHRMVCNAVDLLGVQCGADVKRSEIHAHEKVCPNRLVHCRHSGCGQMFPFADQANQENVCGFRPITCACGMVRIKSSIRLLFSYKPQQCSPQFLLPPFTSGNDDKRLRKSQS